MHTKPGMVDEVRELATAMHAKPRIIDEVRVFE